MATGLRIAVVLLCAAAAAWMFWGSPADNGVVGNANVVGGLAGLAALLVTVLTWRVDRKSTATLATGEKLQAASGYLARETLRYWQGEAKDRKITTPSPATVRWRWADPDVAPPARQIPAATPQRYEAELMTAGVVTRLRRQLYQALPDADSRIVILGGPGAGKTTAMMLLLIEVLKNRPADSSDPVPVWLTLGGWDPSTPLPDWAATVMARDYPGLASVAHGGPTTPIELIRTGRVALFLDGLDEMPDLLRGPALDAIDRATTGLRVVLTSRLDEYQAAAELHRLWNAAVIEVLPVDLDHACDFLLHQQTGARRHAWQEVTDHLRQHPSGVAAQTLTSPLALSLARDTYTHTTANPTDLLDTRAYPTPDALLQHLLTRLLTLAYPNSDDHTRALRWLTWIAHHLNGRRDIRWWDIPTWMAGTRKRLQRTIGIVFGLVLGLGSGLVFGLVVGLTTRRTTGFATGLLAAGLITAYMTGIGVWFGYDPRFRKRGDHPNTFSIRLPDFENLVKNILSGLMFGLLYGLAVAFAYWRVDRSIYGIVVGLVSALAVTLAIAAMDLLHHWQTPLTTARAISPSRTHKSDRQRTFTAWLTAALVAGIGVWFAYGQLAGIGNGTWFPSGYGIRLTVALAVGFGIGFQYRGPASELAVMELVWRVRGRRVRFIPLLQTALHKQVLRQTRHLPVPSRCPTRSTHHPYPTGRPEALTSRCTRCDTSLPR